jgi:hypothetical protein
MGIGSILRDLKRYENRKSSCDWRAILRGRRVCAGGTARCKAGPTHSAMGRH